MKNFIIFGSNRLNENGPLTTFINILEKKKINYYIITSPKKLYLRDANKILFKNYLKKRDHSILSNLDIRKISKLIDKNTIAISFNATWKFKPDLLDLFKKRIYNYHNADLPTQRGAGCISWAILRNIYETSLNFHAIEKDYDSGDIALRKKIFLQKEKINYPSDYIKCIAKHEKQFFMKFIDTILKDKIKLKKQKGESFYWPRLNSKIDGRINWNYDAKDIITFIKSFSQPYSGAFTYIEKFKLKIFKAKFHNSRKFHPYQNGLIFRENKNSIFVANFKGIIKLEKSSIECSQKLNLLGKKFL